MNNYKKIENLLYEADIISTINGVGTLLFGNDRTSYKAIKKGIKLLNKYIYKKRKILYTENLHTRKYECSKEDSYIKVLNCRMQSYIDLRNKYINLRIKCNELGDKKQECYDNFEDYIESCNVKIEKIKNSIDLLTTK